ncbi:hypothetical protein Q8A67_012439 [Cirrhinus molitorella]|uniref:C-type lectin domain-containing protein n=1 Tax=Cirrhinus molitorella TaxID=172907 RepID=A0AA88PT93_9TELE|nr:hypothetical protein Q8A67_012439 [Cirrhinus molitorella]
MNVVKGASTAAVWLGLHNYCHMNMWLWSRQTMEVVLLNLFLQVLGITTWCVCEEYTIPEIPIEPKIPPTLSLLPPPVIPTPSLLPLLLKNPLSFRFCPLTQWLNHSTLISIMAHKLILIKENLMWSEALRYCRQNHVDLVSVNSKEIQHRVMNVVKGASTAAVWLGLHNYCIMNMWLWVSGEMVCYHNWAPGNGTTQENCKLEKRKGAVQSGGDQRWISLPESHKLNFICSRY